MPKPAKIRSKALNSLSFLFSRRLTGKKDGRMIFVEPTYLVIDSLKEGDIVLDFGTGFDADFSQSLMRRFGVTSHGFDPTRKHAPELRQLEREYPGRFFYHPLALSDRNGTMDFHESVENVSGSFAGDHVNVKGKKTLAYPVEAVSLKEAFGMLGLREAALVKIDVEGEEYAVIEALDRETAQRTKQFIFEFHHHCIDRFSIFDTLRALKKMETLGFRYYSPDRINYLFYR